MKLYRIAWGIWIIIMAIVYVFSQSYAGMYMLEGSVVLPAVSILCALAAGRKTEVILSLPGWCRKRDPVQGTLRIRQTGPIPVFKMELNVKQNNLLTGEERSDCFSICLFGNRERVLSFMLKNQLCGCTEVSMESIVIYDLFGIFKKTVKRKNSAKINVLPEMFPLHMTIAPGMLQNNDSLEYSGTRPGFDVSEVFGIREYQEGDSIKNIHWKLTGKCDEILVKLPSLPLENSILLMMETGIAGGVQYGPEIFDAVAEIYVTISQNLLDNGISHEIAWYDQREHVLFSFFIEREEDLSSAMGRILSAGHALDVQSATEHYRQESGAIHTAHLIYVTPEYRNCFDDCGEETRKTMILCSNAAGAAAGEGQILSCTPETYKKELQTITI